MSAPSVTAPPVATADDVDAPVTLPRVVASEWVKFRSLRSTLGVLGGAVLGMFVIGMIVAYNTRQITANLQPNDHVQSSTMQGYYLGQLLIGALGVLFVTGEYSTGMIRSTLAAVPARLPVLWAKLVVFVTVVLSCMLVICVVAFVCAQALISQHRAGYSLGDPGVLRVVLGTAVYLTVIGLIGSALGWIVRSTPGALVAYVALILVLPVLFSDLLGTWGKNVAKFLPSVAGGSFVETIRDPDTLAAWPGLLVMIAWAVVGVGVAAVVLRRRDA